MSNRRRLLIWICIPIVLISSCKERNDIYPPVPWGDQFYGKENIAPRPVSSILVENDHSEWYGSMGAEGLLYNNGYEWKEFHQSNAGIPFDSVTGFLRDGNGLLWVSWKNGLATYDGSAWKAVPELSGKRITSLALQGIGIVWVGIDGDRQTGGLGRYSEGNWSFFSPDGSDIASSHITTLVIDHDQRLWAGSSDKGIITYYGKHWRELSPGSLDMEPARINSMAVDREGNIWAATEASQLVKFRDDTVILLTTGTGKPITGLVCGTDGTIWIGTRGAGLISFLNGNWTKYTAGNMHLPGDSILALARHPNGNILASYSDGHIIYFKY